MPRYSLKDPFSGKPIVMTGDSPPSEAEIDGVLSELRQQGQLPPAPSKIYSLKDPASGKLVQMSLDHQPTADEIVKTLATMRSSGMLPSANKFLQDPNRKPASAEDFISQPKPDAIDSLLSLLPAVGGAGGGIIGGIGGTVAGVGVGGVPGAIGGATLGGATGEAVRQP